MLPIWIKNKKTGRYDIIPYDQMSRSLYLYKGKPLWYVSTWHDNEDKFGRLAREHPKYFLNVGIFMYAFTGRKWGLFHRLLNYCLLGPDKSFYYSVLLCVIMAVGSTTALVAINFLIGKALK